MSKGQRPAADFSMRAFVKAALLEDAPTGDHTAMAVIPPRQRGTMQLLVKDEGVIAGVEAAKMILGEIDPHCKIKLNIRDGSRVKRGDIAFRVSGNMRRLLLAERLLLNVMQRMSGIATHTAALQSLCSGTRATVIDTRKTSPGFRYFEKWAVLIGGGANHRYGLSDMILVKDNHIDEAGSITAAVDAVNRYLRRKRLNLRVEVEARSLADVKEVLSCRGVHRILFDNFSLADTRRAVALVNGKLETESSGGINERNIAAYAKTGVDLISVGALTHRVKSLDLSLKVVS